MQSAYSKQIINEALKPVRELEQDLRLAINLHSRSLAMLLERVKAIEAKLAPPTETTTTAAAGTSQP